MRDSAILMVGLLLPQTACAESQQADGDMGAGWVVAAPADVGLDQEPLARLRGDLQAGVFPNLHAILVIRDGKLAFEEYSSGMGPDSLQYTASVSKSVGSILFGMAADRGLIEGIGDRGIGDAELGLSLTALFPEYAEILATDPRKGQIRLRHILTMSAGLEWDETTFPYSDPRNDWIRASRSEDPAAFTLGREVQAEPGAEFNYNGGLSILLSHLVQGGTGAPADRFAEEHLFGPLGIVRYEWERLDSGLTDTDGGLHLRPRDMAKLGQLYLNGGEWSGKRIVPETWVRLSSEQHIQNLRGPGYGFQWWNGDYHVGDGSVFTFLASGYGGQAIMVFPSLDMVVVLANQVFDNPMGDLNNMAVLSRYILPAADPVFVSPAPSPLDSEDLARYVGQYGSPGDVVTIRLEDGRLLAEAADSPTLVLTPVGFARFTSTILDRVDIQMAFDLTDAGDVRALRARYGFNDDRYERIEE